MIHLLRLAVLALSPALVCGSAGAARQPWIESDVDLLEPYVQQQVRYSLRLYRKSHLQRGSFLTPAVPEAIVKLVQDGAPRPVVRDGVEYELIEQRYLLFPQTSGQLRLPAPVFSSRDLFVEGATITLNVRPMKDSGEILHWLVASGLEAIDHWEPQQGTWKPGDHVQRTVTLEAIGVIGAQLPALQLDEFEGMAVQQVGSRASETWESGRLVGRRTTRILYIPQRAGRFVISPMILGWWDSTSDRPSSTILPGRELVVYPGNSPPEQSPDPSAPASVQGRSKSDRELPARRSIILLTGLILSILALSLVTVKLRERTAGSLRSLRLPRLILRMLKACHRNDANGALGVLRDWAMVDQPKGRPLDLLSLADGQEPEPVKKMLRELDRTLYSGHGHSWQCRNGTTCLLYLMRRFRGRKPCPATNPLPPLWRDADPPPES